MDDEHLTALRAVVNAGPDEYFAWVLREARKEPADESYGQDLLHGFCAALENGDEIPKPILEYLYSGFSSYLSDKQSLEKALLLTAAPGRPDDDSGPLRIKKTRKGGRWRIYNGLVIAALLQLLVKRGMKRDAALSALKDIAPPRSVNRYSAAFNALHELTSAKLRQLVRDEREVSKPRLTEDQKAKLRH